MNIAKAIKSALENYQAGNLREAVDICQKIIRKHPDNINAINLLGIISYQQKDYDSAIHFMKMLVKLNPKDARAHYILGHSMQEKGEIDGAIVHYQKSLQLNPNFADAYYNLGTIFQDLKRNDEAIFCYQRTTQINPTDVDAYYNLGSIFQGKEQFDEAITYYQKTLQLNPNLFDAYNNLGDVFIVKGKLDEGIYCFKKALQLKPNCPQALFNLVNKQELSYSDSKELFELATKMMKQDMSSNDKIDIYFAMGKLCDNLQMFEDSFEYYRLGNMLKRTQVEFNIDSHVDYLSRIKEIYSAEFIESRKSWGCNSEMPIFIFGMPRSGTTLVEQILASHPNVYGGGELPFFAQVEQNLSSLLKANGRYPECSNFIDDQRAHDIAELYIKELRKLAGPSANYTRITNKNPFNCYSLGLISLLFPKASFIHCQRHPLDTCISIYCLKFTTGNEYAYDLNELVQYYREYQKLMNYWRAVLPIRILELKYEDIVQQQEEVSRRLIEFCGLEWDSKCLNFYKKDRPVFTASNWQVRQPIYTSSCGRWQKYDKFIAPLKELLTDFT